MSSSAITHHTDHEMDSTDVFGFWLYIMTDCLLFAALFATYIVLAKPGAYGPSLAQHIDLDYVLIETFALLASNFTFGLSVLSVNKEQVAKSKNWLLLTFIFGVIFLGMELNEFHELSTHGFAWDVSAAASAFFTLVGTHGLHVTAGLLWIVVIYFQLSFFGNHPVVKKRIVYLGLFWNFLDIVWIFLFSIVYLMGVL